MKNTPIHPAYSSAIMLAVWLLLSSVFCYKGYSQTKPTAPRETVWQTTMERFDHRIEVHDALEEIHDATIGCMRNFFFTTYVNQPITYYFTNIQHLATSPPYIIQMRYKIFRNVFRFRVPQYLAIPPFQFTKIILTPIISSSRLPSQELTILSSRFLMPSKEHGIQSKTLILR